MRAAAVFLGIGLAIVARAQTMPAPVASAQSGAPTAAASSQDRIMPMEATVNGAKGGVWVFVERAGALFAPRDAFDEWRLQLGPSAQPIDFKGEAYWPLAAIPGYKSKVDFASQSIELLFAPEAFSALRLTKALSRRPVESPVLPSVFVNYDLSYTGSRLRDAANIHDLGVLTEVGVSSGLGVLTSSHVGRNLTSDRSLGQSRTYLRLETTLTRDFPAQNRTLRLGDSSTRPGMWGRNVYFGGVQYGTNFALTPGFVSQPLPVLTGLSAAPSTVELYINDVLRQVSNVPTGPFAIDNFPAMTGNGEARLVVRDILGRETVISQSFFASSQLLAPGLSDWSLEAGRVRHDLGVANSDYRDRFGAGTFRLGLTKTLTMEGRAEVTPKLRTLGLGVSTALPGQFLGLAALAASDGNRGRGHHWLLGLEREGLRSSVFLQVEGSSRDFRLLGQEEDLEPNRLQVAGNWTYFTASLGSFGLGFASISRYRDSRLEDPRSQEARVTTVSGNYSVNIGPRSSISLYVSRAVIGDSGTSVGMNFVVPLDDSRNVSGASNSSRGKHDFYVAASQGPGRDGDLGWRTLAGRQQDQARIEGGAYYLGRLGTLSGELSGSPDRQAARLGANGGLVLADGKLFATRRVDQAFAVAEVAGYADIGVGLGSNVLARTDADGVALIPNLWPYQQNSVRLDPRDLPVSAELDSIEQVVVPAWRSAVKVKFPVRSGRGALLRIVLDDGQVAPAGATVRIEGEQAEFYVARRGEAFVTGLLPANRLVLSWQGRQCRFDVVLPPENADEVTRLGPLQCKGILQ